MGEENACIAVHSRLGRHREKIHFTGSIPRLDFSLLFLPDRRLVIEPSPVSHKLGDLVLI